MSDRYRATFISKLEERNTLLVEKKKNETNDR